MTRQLGFFTSLLAAAAIAAAFLTVAGTAAADDFPAAPGYVTATFTTPGEHVFNVPAGTSSVLLHAVGGRGGSAFLHELVAGSPGGAGADARATIDVSGVTTFYAEVGSDGSTNASNVPAGAVGGGGAGGQGDVAGYYGGAGGAGGGGASDVRLCPSGDTGCDSLASRVLVGAGGGGAGAGPNSKGGDGGLPNGFDAEAPDASLPPVQGATVDAPGVGGFDWLGHPLSGGFGRGANGADFIFYGGGGGGGGYYGGAGGYSLGTAGAAGGGGGSSFAVYGARDVSYTAATDKSLVSIGYTSDDAPTIGGSPHVGSTLHVSWPGHEAGATYRWEYCISQTICAAIWGAAAPDLQMPAGGVGSVRIRAVVTAPDGVVVGTSAQTAFVMPPDTTAPTIQLASPADGATYQASATIPASYSCADEDAGSGIATCAAPVASGDAIDTSTAGDHVFTVTATDEAGNTATRTVHYSVSGGPPLAVSPPTIAGIAQDGHVLTAQPGTWQGALPIARAYGWQRCDAAGANCTVVAMATSNRYRLGPRDIGSTLRVVVTGTNAEGSTAAQSDTTAVVVATPPVNAKTPTITKTVRTGRVGLQAQRGTWQGSPTLVFGYQWQRCDAAGQNCSDIAGATRSSYEVRAGQTGFTFRVVVTGSNAAGRATAMSAAVAPAG